MCLLATNSLSLLMRSVLIHLQFWRTFFSGYRILINRFLFFSHLAIWKWHSSPAASRRETRPCRHCRVMYSTFSSAFKISISVLKNFISLTIIKVWLFLYLSYLWFNKFLGSVSLCLLPSWNFVFQFSSTILQIRCLVLVYLEMQGLSCLLSSTQKPV